MASFNSYKVWLKRDFESTSYNEAYEFQFLQGLIKTKEKGLSWPS